MDAEKAIEYINFIKTTRSNEDIEAITTILRSRPELFEAAKLIHRDSDGSLVSGMTACVRYVLVRDAILATGFVPLRRDCLADNVDFAAKYLTATDLLDELGIEY